MEGINLVKTTSYGPMSKLPDAVLIVPHDGDSGQLVQAMGPVFYDRSETLDEYLRIDKDVGSSELAEAIANKIVEINGSLRVAVVKVLFERGILDANRTIEKAIIKIFKPGRASAEIVQLLTNIHGQTMAIIKDQLDQLDHSNGLFLGVHTMAPYTPTNLNGPHPDRLSMYNEAYTSRNRRGARRWLNLITATPQSGIIANPTLQANTEGILRQNKVTFRQNNPYPLSGYPEGFIQDIGYMKRYPGLVVDLPKDDLCVGIAEDPAWDITDLEVDDEKVEHLAEFFAQAIVESLDMIRHGH